MAARKRGFDAYAGHRLHLACHSGTGAIPAAHRTSEDAMCHGRETPDYKIDRMPRTGVTRANPSCRLATAGDLASKPPDGQPGSRESSAVEASLDVNEAAVSHDLATDLLESEGLVLLVRHRGDDGVGARQVFPATQDDAVLAQGLGRIGLGVVAQVNDGDDLCVVAAHRCNPSISRWSAALILLSVIVL